MQQLQMVLRREVARMLLQGQAGYAAVEDAGDASALNDLVDDYARLGGESLPPPHLQAGDHDMIN